MHISVFVCAVLVVRFIHLSSGVKIKFGHHRPQGICITQDLILFLSYLPSVCLDVALLYFWTYCLTIMVIVPWANWPEVVLLIH